MYTTRARSQLKARDKGPAGERNRGNSPQRALLSQDTESESPKGATMSATVTEPTRVEEGAQEDKMQDPSVA